MILQTHRKQKNPWYRLLTMFSLVLAGETVFLPAFHLGRYFKSSLLETYGLDEFQLGQLGAIYGVTATISYFLGGPLADRWSPRRLLVLSLISTALGSLYMATVPNFAGLQVLFGFWGVSTILLFWAPLIKATRQWAKTDQQARAFGILDAGRGLASAVIASLAAWAFSMMAGGNVESTNPAERVAVVTLVISYAGYCLLAAACVWLFVPDSNHANDASSAVPTRRKTSVWIRLFLVLRSPTIWLQALIIVAAYSAFKMIDNYGLYAEDAYGFSRSQSASLMANVSYIRVVAALAAGWIADRLLGVRATIQICFGLLLIAYAGFLLVSPTPGLAWVMVTNIVISCTAFFALRGIYFALLEDSHIPQRLTGTAVGVISFVGYAPEIYMGPLTGWLIREARAQGNVLAGYHAIFLILSVLCICGLLSGFALRWFRKSEPAQDH